MRIMSLMCVHNEEILFLFRCQVFDLGLESKSRLCVVNCFQYSGNCSYCPLMKAAIFHSYFTDRCLFSCLSVVSMLYCCCVIGGLLHSFGVVKRGLCGGAYPLRAAVCSTRCSNSPIESQFHFQSYIETMTLLFRCCLCGRLTFCEVIL